MIPWFQNIYLCSEIAPYFSKSLRLQGKKLALISTKAY
jgi:hypothetical protein